MQSPWGLGLQCMNFEGAQFGAQQSPRWNAEVGADPGTEIQGRSVLSEGVYWEEPMWHPESQHGCGREVAPGLEACQQAEAKRPRRIQRGRPKRAMSGKEADQRQSVTSCHRAPHRMWSKERVVDSAFLWEPWVQMTRVAWARGGSAMEHGGCSSCSLANLVRVLLI